MNNFVKRLRAILSNVTLRLRLTLFYTLVVTLVLVVSGIGLYFLLSHNLYATLDSRLQESSDILASLIEYDTGQPMLHEYDEEDMEDYGKQVIPISRADLVAATFTSNGKLIDSLGSKPENLEVTPMGFNTWKDWRVYTQKIPRGILLTLIKKKSAQETLRQFVISFCTLVPFASLFAFLLGYSLAGLALSPVDRLTKATYDLANRRAWRERLPEPTSRDELWRLARGTNELLVTLEHVIESERRFTADAAHELRTPLAILRGRVEKASEKASDEEISLALNKALKASDDLLGLIEKLLVLARTEAGQGLTFDKLALDDVAFNSAESLRHLFDDKGLNLTLDLPPEPIWIQGDFAALGLAIGNLLENALKFTAKGTVTLTTQGNNGQAVIVIEDSGPGIPEESLPNIFERFYQAEVKYRSMGSGLGLALVKSIVAWHGGEIKVENRLEGGSRFILSIPQIDNSTSEAITSSSTRFNNIASKLAS